LPYIPEAVFENNVEENVKKWEPKFAFVWWDDGCDLYRQMFDQIIETKRNFWEEFGLIMFLEMMDWQVDLLNKEYWKYFQFDKVKTFHFNIKIVKAKFK
jgi:methylase of polypeptide subunit release factors